jgi:O-antigen/teichoic acid export membrane protein
LSEPELEPTNLSDTVVRGAGLAGAGYILAQVFTLGFFLVLARLATPSDFGEFAAGSFLVSIGLLFTESGMMAALIHRPDRIEEAANTAVITTFFSGLGLALLALAASPLIGLLFDSSTVGRIAAATSGLLFLRSLPVVPEALLQRQFSFLRRMVVEPAGVVAFGIAAVIACSNDLGPWGLVIGYYAGAVVDVILSWTLVRWRPRLRLASVSMWRELIGYGRFVLASNVVMRVGEQVPVLLLGRFVGTGALGQYRYADRMASTPLALLVQAASYVLFPAFARITGDRQRYRDATLRSLRMMCLLAFPLGSLLVPLGEPAAVLLFGEVWRQAGYAAMALAAVPVAGTLVSFASEAFKADGRPDILARLHVVSVAATSVAVLALLPFDLVGVSGGISIGMVVAATYAMAKVRRLIGFEVRETVSAFAIPGVAAIAMIAILTPVEFLLVDATAHGTVAGLCLLVAESMAGLAIYAGALALISPVSAKEIGGLLLQLLRRDRRDASTDPAVAAGSAKGNS